MDEPTQLTDRLIADAVRDPLATPEAVLEARRHSMPDRLELALSWNMVAAELRAGLAEVKGRTKRR
jgi:hypothetical protein